MDITSMILIVPLFALVIALVDSIVKRRPVSDDEPDLMIVAQYIYDLDDPETLMELAILTDVRRLLLHMELTEGRQRLG